MFDANAAANVGSSVSGALGTFVSGYDSEDMPPSIRHEAKRAILNYFGVALGSMFDPAGALALEAIMPMAGRPNATLIGSDTRLDELSAAFMNALNANVLEFDDTHLPTIIHPTAPVASGVFALAEGRPVSGKALLDAFVLGVEVTCRAGNGVSPGHYERGWHITATCGGLGAAAACARLLHLSPSETAHALGIAASQASGIVENLPTGAKNVQVGNSARCGLLSALFAEAGLTSAPEAIEGTYGWARAMGDELDRDALVGGLGKSWELSKNAYKAYPCGIVLAPVIDGCLELRRKYGFRPEDIDRVTVRGSALLLARADRPVVSDERIAKLSIHHSVAAAFVRGAAGVKEFREFRDAEIVAFRGKVTAHVDDALTAGEAVVVVTTQSGQTVEARVAEARGSLQIPLTDREIEAKVRDLAILGGSGVEISPLIDAVWALEESRDAGNVMALTAPHRGMN